MIESLQKLIEALRHELQQYGEMLALLDRQQERVIARAASDVFQSIGFIQAQANAIQQARSSREQCRRAVAQELHHAEESTLGDLIPRLLPDYQPLVKALVEENNSLLVRVQQRLRQNHLLLSRSVEYMQSFLNSLFPSRETLVYNDHGNMRSYVTASRPLYEAVG